MALTLARSSSSIEKISRNFVDVSKPDLILSLCYRHQNKVNRDKFCGCFSPHTSQVNVNISLRLSGEKNPIIYESVFPAAGPSKQLSPLRGGGSASLPQTSTVCTFKLSQDQIIPPQITRNVCCGTWTERHGHIINQVK